jgi:putative ABC transport system permease protein
MDDLLQEMRIGVRSMARSPGLTGVAVLALALGIGLTTTMFSIVNGVILEGLPFEESERLYTSSATSLPRASTAWR